MQDKSVTRLAYIVAGVIGALAVFSIVHIARGEQLCDLAPEWRQFNVGGSCGHASTTSALRWVQLFPDADKWWATYRGGENFQRHLSRLKSAGFKYVETHDGDTRILDYAAASRRMAVVYWPTGHITCFVGYIDSNGKRCCSILDNNHVKHLDFHEYRQWVQSWCDRGGCAFVVLDGTPPPPVPE